MKDYLLKLISLTLIFVFATLALSSCGLMVAAKENDDVSGDELPPDNNDEKNETVYGPYPEWNFYPEGYTAGFPRDINKPAPRIEYWWVETYEEALAAIELLKSHGSTFQKSAIFTHDGELFDTKYCFQIDVLSNITEKIEFGDNPFDRCAGNVKVTSYAFFDDVTIDEINHSDISDYKKGTISSNFPLTDDYKEPPVLNEEDFTYLWTNYGTLKIFDDRFSILTVSSFGYHQDPDMGRIYLRAVFNSLEFIGFE